MQHFPWKETLTIKANNLYIYRVLISHRLECHCCHVGISKYLYFPPIQFSGPNILSLSFDPNHQFRGACANKSTSAPGPVSAPRVPWTHWHIPPGSPPPGGSQRLVPSPESETFTDLFRRKYWSSVGRGCPWPPWIVSWHERRDHSYTLHNGNGLLSYNSKIICFSFSSHSQHKADSVHSLSSPKVCFGRFRDKWRFSIQLWSSRMLWSDYKVLRAAIRGGTGQCLAINSARIVQNLTLQEDIFPWQAWYEDINVPTLDMYV